MGPTDRVVVLIDMDCFYCQVEEKLNPKLRGQPIAVVQYNAWRGGGVIAVNYPARDQGVTRHMRGNDARKKCPSINLVRVPEVRGKADLSKYRDAGKEVADVLATFTPLLQRASVDEAYLDITELVKEKIASSLEDLVPDNLKNTFVVGYDNLKDFLKNTVTNREFTEDNFKLAVGGLITEKIRQEVYEKTGYKCSAGIAHNKILAKLVCSLHKPNKQTILPHEAVDKFFETMPINKIKSLGGKFGQTLTEDLQISYMGQLKKFTEKELGQKYDEKTANWLYNIARGIDNEPVTTKLISKSIACCKNFQGITALTTTENVQHWLNELAAELSERLEKDLKENNRKAKQVIVNFTQEVSKKDVSSSRTHPLTSYDPKKIARNAFEVIRKFCLKADGSYHIKHLGLNASNFEDVKKIREITSFFKAESIQLGQSTSNCELSDVKTVDENIDKTYFKTEQNKFKMSTSNCEFNNNFAVIKTEVLNENVDSTDCSNNSNDIYHQLTQELDENVDDLLFYDDSYRIKHEQNLPLLETQNVNHKISETTNHKKMKGVPKRPLSSFFKQYFKQGQEGMTPKKRALSPVINGMDLDDNIHNKEIPTDKESLEICPECNKRIPLSQFMSHKDYHFALTLTKNNVNTEQCISSIKKSINSKRKSAKKSPNTKVDSKSNLMSFFNTTTAGDASEPTELCSECNKKIKVDDFSSHMDYHVAKKIHLELNAAGSAEIVNKPKCIPKNKSQKNIQPMTSFFKRV